MAVFAPRRLWFALALGSGAAGILTVALTQLFRLDPCYLCIFQRLLMLALASLSLLAAIATRTPSLIVGALAAVIAAIGVGTSLYQSWLQWMPKGSATCTNGDPGLIEQLVDWLGARAPNLFMATGFCEDDGMVILGLTLANWAALAFVAGLAAAAVALARTLRSPHPA